MTSEIDKLKHFHIENYSGTNFTNDLNDGEEFLYTTIRCEDDKEVTLLCKYVKNKHIGNCPDCVFNKYLCYGLLCNIVVLKVIKDEESKRYIKKQNNKPLINKKVLAKVIRESNICKHAIKELKLAGYGKGEGGPDDWMYQQVIEAVAVFAGMEDYLNIKIMFLLVDILILVYYMDMILIKDGCLKKQYILIVLK